MVRLWSASIAILLVSASSIRAQMSGEEGRLIRFFEVTNGPLWRNNSNWNTTAPICTWFGVGCAPGRTADNVTSLVLESNNLAGRIAKLIYEMPHLQVLNLKENQLTDAGFDGFGAAEVTAPLTTLQLASNALTKVDGIGNAPKTLTELHFSENHIKGPFPMELFQLTNLRHLLLSFNAMTGTLPTEIGKLSLLQDFYLFGNLFTGQIPSEIGLLTSVEVFTLAENAFHGTIPREVSNMAALQTFSIHNNEDGDGLITGPLRPFDNCPFLDELYLDGNALTGTIPSNFLKRVNDTHATMAVGLSGNKLNGTLPTALTRFTSMTLDVTDNQIQGLPDSLCEKRAWMSGLVESFKCDAILCPPGTYNEDGRQTSSGMSCKDCPSGVAGSRFFGSKHCSLVGEELPEWRIVAKFYVDLRGTEWVDKTGWEVLDALLQTTKLEDLDGSALIFCGWFGITCNAQKQVEEINLSNNGLTGQIPKETFYLPALKILDVSRCAVTMDGAIGFQSVARAIHLESLNMAGSSITSLDGIGSGTSLKRLVLDSIQLNNATFPFDLCQLTNLEFLQMEFTYVKGGLPSQIGNLRKLTMLNLYNNDLSGTVPTQLGLLTNLLALDLSENAFVGSLPSELNALTKLQTFHIHQVRGKLTGTLPSFEKLTSLVEFSVDTNEISGTIPVNFLQGVVDKTKHITIGLSFNKLVGAIPMEFDAFLDMDLHLEGNMITHIPIALCSKPLWMNEEVGKLKSCAAILCPQNSWGAFGMASSREDARCNPCPGNKFMGSTACAVNVTKNPEKEILDKLFTATGGRYWKSAINWTEHGVPICYREGVYCDADSDANSGVDELRLNGMGLEGVIPSEIFDLPRVRLIGLSNNDVDLTFEHIANATNLRTLQLSNTSIRTLVGIGRAPSKLTEIHIANNQLKGSIPEELFQLTNVLQIFANDNLLTGTLPSSISGMSVLKDLFLANNDISGQLPTEVSFLTSLEVLDLHGNKISGYLPTAIESLVNLRVLLLGSQGGANKLSGPLLDFKNNLKLVDLDLTGNSLQGTIPSTFLQGVGQTADIQVFLSGNEIQGEIPTSLDKLAKLNIDLSGNKINGLSGVLCDSNNTGWMEGKVGQIGCNAILCPPGTALPAGRQVETATPCKACANGIIEARYFGSKECVPEQVNIERSVLMTLYILLNGTEWLDQTNWNSDKSVCTWFGITCNSSAVTEISLEGNNLDSGEGDVSALLFSLPHLKSVDLKGNKVALNLVKIPASTQLEMLQLSATGLKSLVGVSTAKGLRQLHVTDNDLKGNMPDEIFALTNLRSLYLSFNEFTGPLPSSIGNLSQLEEFYMYGNNITGPLPGQAISKLTSIVEFIMAENFLSGDLPSEFSSLPNLEQLSLFGQQGKARISGTIPNFSGAPKLWYFDVTGNEMTGTIPSDFMKNSIYDNDEVTVYLGQNSLTGSVPSSLDAFTNMDLLIVGNKITSIPAELCDNPDWMGGLSKTIGTCAAIACLPGTWSSTGKQEVENPCVACENTEFATFWGQMKCKSSSVEEEALRKIYSATGGKNWAFQSNWNSDQPICSWKGITCGDGSQNDNEGVTDIDLSNNNLVGILPPEAFSFPSLKSLNVKDNYYLTVTFVGLDMAPFLELLYLSGTNIDNLNGISYAQNLIELHLTDCGMSGPIPSEFFELASTLKEVYMDYNFFSGTFPKAIASLTSLTDFYAYDSDFTGTIPTEFGLITSLETLVLAENLFSGSIPSQFSQLPFLAVFSVYRRDKPGPMLSGSLPAFDKVPKLTDLYLDGNDLSGAIPANFLASSDYASLVVLSHMQLEGAVPEGIGRLHKLNIQLEGNAITSFPLSFCNNSDWMDGQIFRAGCNAFLCPPGWANSMGRANQTTPCEECAVEGIGIFYGTLSCAAPFTERSVLIKLHQQCGGSAWHRMDGWTTTTPLCKWYGITCNAKGSVESINLGNNNLVGTLNSEIFDLVNLKSLWLHSNPIDVNFKNIGSAKKLTELRLDATNVNRLDNLNLARTMTLLDLRFNQLPGVFPRQILKLTNLRSLNLGDNQFSGPLPASFIDLKYLRILRLGSNKFSGKIPSFEDMNLLDTLDLSGNFLTGTIPAAFLNRITTTANLEVDLSSNQLSGTIPAELDRLDRVTLYLRDNKIVGLPEVFCNNVDWNDGDVESHGCNGILCPPGTFSVGGRARGVQTCLPCGDDVPFYGQDKCRLPMSSASRMMTWLGTIALFACISWI